MAPIKQPPLIHGIAVTYRRLRDLAHLLLSMTRQTRTLESLLVIDNGPQAEGREVVALAEPVFPIEYIATGENLGPAGALALGTRRILQHASDQDWILFLDDDNPPPDNDTLDRLVTFAEQRHACDSSTGAVGLAGGRFDARSARVVRPADGELRAAVAVDHIGGGQLPLYRASVLQRVGVSRADLFFGFDDLELGLRVRSAGFSMYVDGAHWAHLRARYGRLGISAQPVFGSARSPSWRDYYGLRNLIVISRINGHATAALRVTARAGLARAAVQVVRSPSVARQTISMHARGCLDGWTMRLGRRVDPT